MHLEKVVKDAEKDSQNLKSLVRMLTFLANTKESAPSKLLGSQMMSFVKLALQSHSRYNTEDFTHLVQAVARINSSFANTLAHDQNLVPVQ